MILRPPRLRDRMILPEDPFMPRVERDFEPRIHHPEFLNNPYRFGFANDATLVTLLHADGIANPRSFRDEAYRGWWRDIPQTAAGPVLSTAQSKFGGSSILFNGTNEALRTKHAAEFNISAGPLTLEAWAYCSTLPTSTNSLKCILRKGTGTSYLNGWWFGLRWDGTKPVAFCQFGNGSDTTCFGTTSVPANTWFHIAATFVPGQGLRIFYNGALEGTTNTATLPVNNTEDVTLGGDLNDTTRYWSGYMDEIRIKRAELFTASFTPPAGAYSDKSLGILNAINPFGRGADTILHGASVYQTGANATHAAANGPRIFVSPKWIDSGTTGLPAGIQIPISSSSDPLNGNAGDFTYQFWVYPIENPDASGYALMDIGGGYNYSWPNIRIHASGTTAFEVALRSTSVSDTTAPDIANFESSGGAGGGGVSANNWTHIALTRQGNVFRLWRNGAQAWTKTSSLTIKASGGSSLPLSGFNLGCTGYDVRTKAPSFAFQAYYQAFGAFNTCLYTAAFTPPARPT